jgi:Flp pilus assembly pilin Flp
LSFFRDEEGQDLVEYAFLLGVVSLAAGAILTSLGQNISTFYSAETSKVVAARAAIK